MLCSQYMSVQRGKSVLGKGGAGSCACRLAGTLTLTRLCPTHLSYFSRGDLPLVGASKGTGDIPVEKWEERYQCPQLTGHQEWLVTT